MHARRELIAAVVLVGLGVGYGWLTAGLPERSMPNTPGSRFFPWIIAVSLLSLAAAMLVRALRRLATEADAGLGLALGRGTAAFAAFVVYVAALPWLGFLLATVPFFAVLMALFGERRRWVLAVGALVVPIVMFVLFRHGFQIVLPAGRIGWP